MNAAVTGAGSARQGRSRLLPKEQLACAQGSGDMNDPIDS